MALIAGLAFAQDSQQSAPPADSAATTSKPAPDPSKPDADHVPQDAEHAVDKRVMGVLPNYRTINETGVYTPISAKQKLIIASKDSFDYPLWGVAAAFAGMSQLQNDDPSFGQGVKGYAHRLITNYADQAVGNMMSEGFMPALLHEDPRYRRLGAGRGSNWHRAWYAVTRVMVTRTDSGGTTFNFSEWGGNAIGVAVSNVWHPDSRNWSDNTKKLGEQVGTDAISQVLKEFWPDIKHKLFHKEKAAAD
ncbi:MAG TPA: hypothetical protein VMT15_04950 [Bryobacteraceae bacterium]|nr:hypothetical protein [Bryobacteraceae bacterium]